MNWIQLSLQTSKNNVEAWSDALTSAGAAAVTLEGAEGQAIYELKPGHAPLWDNITIIALFTADHDQSTIMLQLANKIAMDILSQAQWKNISEQDWIRKWQANLQPILFGNKLWITPSWCNVPDPSAKHIILDPEMAFGTGSHPTTSLCLEWIAQNIKPGDTLIDYGCGSGILALAAAKLGASKVIGIDLDPIALEVSNKNANKNDISPEIFACYLPEQAPFLSADIIIANILAKPLIELAPTFIRLLKPRGTIVLSGILAEQAANIQSVYTEWFTDFSISQQDEWVRISAVSCLAN